MATLRGRVWDQKTGRPLEARVHVLGSTGAFYAPTDAIQKVGGGDPYFYSDGTFALDVPTGQTDVIVERGTEYRPLRMTVDARVGATIDLDLPLDRWISMPERGWYAGNTHVHYNEKETRAVERLRLDPRVEDLPVLVVSMLVRRDLAYASNAFPIGRHELSTPEHVIDIGEESRHNDEPWRIGLGHIMLINIEKIIEPVSRGLLIDDSAPDYPPLVDACDGAREQGGLVLWCHNANGMEAPIASALGKLDGLNLFDPYWMDPEYELWYRLLNCGARLPASTGSDWFLCSSNRVYVDVGDDFSYERWLTGLREGRTFITDGPILNLTVAGHAPCNEVLGISHPVENVPVVVEWQSHQPVDRIEIVRDGIVVATYVNGEAATSGTFAASVDAVGAGWIAARCWGVRRTSYGHALWAHTSPVYLRERPAAEVVRDSAAFFVERIGTARRWIETKARFNEDAQRARMLRLFDEGRDTYLALQRGS